MKKLTSTLIFLILITTIFLVNISPPMIEHIDVYTSGEGYWYYRIPAIETAPDGALLAFAEARKYGRQDPGFGQQDVDLVLKRSTDSGKTWSKMEVIDDPGEGWSAANPTTLVDKKTSKIWLLYLQAKPGKNMFTSQPGTNDVQTIARFSKDNGLTWSEKMDLTDIARDMNDDDWVSSVVGPGGAIQSKTGRLLFPIWKDSYNTFTIYSDDNGNTWHRGDFVPGDYQGNENQLIELDNGQILMDIRQASGEIRHQAISNDDGETWSEVFPGRKTPPCSCAIERLTTKSENGGRNRILWTGPRGPGRTNLMARVSYDEGITFPLELVISNGPAAYSDLTMLNDNTAGILWERENYEYITFSRLDTELLESQSIKHSLLGQP